MVLKIEEKVRRTHAPAWVGASGECYEAIRLGRRDVWLFHDDSGYRTVDFLEAGEDEEIWPIQHTLPRFSFESLDGVTTPQLADLYAEVHRFLDTYWRHRDPRVLQFMALYFLHTYVLTRSIGTIFVWLVGARRAGKTTLQILAQALAYRAFSALAPSEAALYRTLGCDVEYGPLVICREYERASDLMREISREGDIPGATIPRADKVDDVYTVLHYYLYGARLMASNKLHGNEADMDRYLVIRCASGKPARPRSELIRKKEVLDALADLRSRLLMWKVASHADFAVPYEDPRGEIPEGRDWEHYGGVIHLASLVSAELEADVRSYVLESIREAREEEASSLDAMIAQAIVSLMDAGHRNGDSYRMKFAEVWSMLAKVCTLAYDKHGEQLEGRLVTPDGQQFSTHLVGRTIRDKLLGKREVWREGAETVKGYSWTDKTMSAIRSVTDVTDVTDKTGREGTNRRLELDNETEKTGTGKEDIQGYKTGTTETTVTGRDMVPGDSIHTLCAHCGQIRMCTLGEDRHWTCAECGEGGKA